MKIVNHNRSDLKLKKGYLQIVVGTSWDIFYIVRELVKRSKNHSSKWWLKLNTYPIFTNVCMTGTMAANTPSHLACVYKPTSLLSVTSVNESVA